MNFWTGLFANIDKEQMEGRGGYHAKGSKAALICAAKEQPGRTDAGG